MIFLKTISKKIILSFFILSSFLVTGKTSFAEALDFDIIVPVNETYDPYPLKKLDDDLFNLIYDTTDPDNITLDESLTEESFSSLKDPEDGYNRYLEILTEEENLIDSDGYYYPTLTFHIGSGNTEELITVSTSVLEYYLVSEDGVIINEEELDSNVETEAFARIYSVVGFESNNVQIGDKTSNVKYDVTYRSDYTFSSGETIDVFHIVKSAEGAEKDQEKWMFLTEGLMPRDGTPLITVNAMNRTYFDPSGPNLDNSGLYTWSYYQEVNGLRLIPIDPEKDGDCFSVVQGDNNEKTTSLPLSGAEDLDSYRVLIEGNLIESDAIYYDFYEDILNITNEMRELEYISYEIRISDGLSDLANGDLISSGRVDDIGGLFYKFKFYADYNALLATGSDAFDIILTGSSSNDTESNKVTVKLVLDDIKLPKININKLTVQNNTIRDLWQSMGLLQANVASYSTANFTADDDGAIPVLRDSDGNDGNYAKDGDSISIYLSYTSSCSGYTLSENSPITFFMRSKSLNINPNPSSITESEVVYSAMLTGFTENGIGYLLLKNSSAISGDEEGIELLYIDNVEAQGEAVALSPGGTILQNYINNSNNTLGYSSSEDIAFDPNSTTRDLEQLLQGLSGTRAYLNIFDYDSKKSDIDRYNAANDPDITNPEPHNDSKKIEGYSHYYRIINGSGSFEENISLNGHENDGEYDILKLIAVDKAGNIGTVNKNNLETILSELATAGFTNSVYQYYIDTIIPDITAKLEKTKDANGLDLTGEIPFKVYDTLKLSLTLDDYNLYSYNVSEFSPYLTVNGIDSSPLPDADFPVDKTILDTATPAIETIEFTVENSNDDGTVSATATITDKAGNTNSSEIEGELLNSPPVAVSLELYEEYWGDNWMNKNIEGDSGLKASSGVNEYRFSKGALISNSSSPDLYITNIDYLGKDRVKILGVNISGKGEIFYDHDTTTTSPEDIKLAEINNNDTSISGFYLIPDSKNTVTVTPYGTSGLPGPPTTVHIVIDTEVNSGSMDSQTMHTAAVNNSNGKYEFELDFKNILELAGLKGYKIASITNSGKSVSTSVVDYPVGDSSLTGNYEDHLGLFTTPFTELTGNSIEKVIRIDKADLKQGSRATIKVSVIDALGSQKSFDLNYLLVEPSVELKVKTKDSNRLRKSFIRLVGDDDEDGFNVETLEETGE